MVCRCRRRPGPWTGVEKGGGWLEGMHAKTSDGEALARAGVDLGEWRQRRAQRDYGPRGSSARLGCEAWI